MKKRYLLGLDGGTTGCKTCIFDLDGNLIASDYREYPCRYPRPGWVEQVPEDLLPAFYESIRAAVAKSGVDPADILGFGFSSQGSVIGLLDGRGELIRPFVGWQDLRGMGEATDYLLERISRSDIYRIAGDPVGTVFSNTKLAWLKLNEPENWEKTELFSTHQDYFLKQFGADGYYTDLSSASREGMMDVDAGTWSEEIHDALGIPLSKRPRIVSEPGRVVGRVSKELSEKTGLLAGTPICMGAHDQNCCTFGAGAVESGTAVIVMGTFGSCFVVSDKPVRDPKERLVVKGNHGVGNYTVEAFSGAAASSLRWYRDTFCGLEKQIEASGGEDAYRQLDRAIAEIPVGAEGITFLPYLQGASGARLNGNARGVFLGMTLATSKAQMSRAVMEGICFEMNDILHAEREAGIPIDRIRLTGGAAKSPLWCQMMADIFGRPIDVLEANESGCLGAALYAGVGVGVYKDCREASETVRISRTYLPDPERFEAYEKAYRRFVSVYEALDGRVF